jgi:hypothetical protein
LFNTGNIALFILLCFASGDRSMDNIGLELTFTKQEFIQGESIPFSVVLKNISSESLLLNSFDAKNQSVSLVAEGKSGEKIGTQMSW